MPTRPKTLEVLTMTPLSCSTRSGRKARVPLTTPSKLVCRSHSSSPGSASRTDEATATPALLNTAPSAARPANEVSQARTSVAKWCTSAASRTSSTLVSTGPGSDLAVSFRPASLTSAMATGEPDRDSRWARLRPMPEAAPVIITGLPAMILRFLTICTPSHGGADAVGDRESPAAHHSPAALGWAEGHAPVVPPLAAFTRRLQREVAEHRAQYHVHLHAGEGGADTPPDAAAERDPLVSIGPGTHEAVRVEASRVREQGLVAVDQVDAHQHDLPFRERPSSQPQARRAYLAYRPVDDRTHPLDLQDRGLAQLRPAGVGLVGESAQHRRVPSQPLDRPGQRGRRGLVPSGQQGKQLVGYLLAAHPNTVVVPALQHQREHVVTLVQPGIPAGRRDQPVDDRVVFAAVDVHPAPRAPPAQIGLRDRQGNEPRAEFDHPREQAAQLGQLGPVRPEHRAQDRIESDAHHRPERGELAALRPRRHLADRLLLDDGFVGAQPPAVERRGQQLALPAVRVTAYREEGVGAEHQAQVEIEDVGQLRTGHEQLLDLGRVADHDGVPEDRDIDLEGGAVPVVQPAHHPQRSDDRHAALHEARERGAIRQGHGVHARLRSTVRGRTISTVRQSTMTYKPAASG